MRCHECDSDQHLIRECPRRRQAQVHWATGQNDTGSSGRTTVSDDSSFLRGVSFFTNGPGMNCAQEKEEQVAQAVVPQRAARSDPFGSERFPLVFESGPDFGKPTEAGLGAARSTRSFWATNLSRGYDGKPTDDQVPEKEVAEPAPCKTMKQHDAFIVNSQLCTQKTRHPIALDSGEHGTYAAPVVSNSDVPALLDLKAPAEHRTLSDVSSALLFQVSPGGCKVQLSPGSIKYQLKRAPSDPLSNRAVCVCSGFGIW